DKKYEKKDPVTWAWESYQIANNDIYPYGEIKNNYLYNYQFKKIMEDRLWLAGKRLADILNDLYK
ncbi:MAG: S1/P1 nuclease, partial [Chitinophagaceae bacterium]